ncbi:MAG TPA: TRAP transporter substrate-binding protein [Methylomirabilota bacterium]|nr:TRAP transporter substrate-binding protein [Methylomirabilota bacterium]
MRRWATLGMTLIVAVSLVTLVATGSNGATMGVRLGHGMGPNHHINKAAFRFKEVVESRSSGAIKVELFPGQVMGNDEEMLVATTLGTLDVVMAPAGAWGILQPEFQLFSLVYMFRDAEHAEKVFRGPMITDLSGKLVANKSIRILAPFFYYGKRQLTANKPIRRPEDLKGLTIRVPNVRVHQEGVAALGGQATPLNFPEVYLALKQGVMDGQENPASQILDGKLYEVQKYLMLTEHIITNFVMGANEASFKRLSPDQQKIFVEAAKEAEAYNNELAFKEEKTAVEALAKNGMTVITPDKPAFIKVTEPVRLKYAKDFVEVYRRIQDTK